MVEKLHFYGVLAALSFEISYTFDSGGSESEFAEMCDTHNCYTGLRLSEEQCYRMRVT